MSKRSKSNLIHPDIVNNMENFEQNLLLSSLQNCEPYVFPETASLHLDELIKKKSSNDLQKLNEKLHELASLRVKIDQEDARTDSRIFSELLKKLSEKAEEINGIVGYEIIIDPKLILKYRYQKNLLERNLNSSQFAPNIKERMLRELNKKIIQLIAKQHVEHISKKLPSLTATLEKINNSFQENNEIPFIDTLEQELGISAIQ